MQEKKLLNTGIIFVLSFILWTVIIQNVNVMPIGESGTDVGLAALNSWFHDLTGVNMTIYYITDWLSLVPLFCCMIFGMIGFVQLIKRKSLFKVDSDIILLGVYYLVIILGYLFFETFTINYRPILIHGITEASYPSSTTLLVLSVMPTVIFQVKRRIKAALIRNTVTAFAVLFSLLMVIGRTIAGVHWLTDIIGSITLSTGLYLIYLSSVLRFDNMRND